MLLALKGNRETQIDANDKQRYIEAGHKIVEIDDKGKQKVLNDPVAVEKSAVKEVEQLKVQLAEREAKIVELEAQLAEKEAKK